MTHVRLDIAAKRYIGVPFRHQGRNPSVGIDCVGLLVLSARDCGYGSLSDYDGTSYDRNPARGELERRIGRALTPYPELLPGCVVCMDFFGKVRHVGIISQLDDGRLGLIHSYNKPPRVVENGINERWMDFIKSVYRLEAV